jgi:hypothetical protein
MSQNAKKILGFVVACMIILLFSTRGCNSSKEKVEKTTTTTTSPDPTIELLQKQVADLQKQLSEAKPTGSPTPSSQQPGPSVVVVDSAVDVEKKYWRDKVRDTKIANEQKIAEAEGTEEKKQQLQDRVEDIKKEIASAISQQRIWETFLEKRSDADANMRGYWRGMSTKEKRKADSLKKTLTEKQIELQELDKSP